MFNKRSKTLTKILFGTKSNLEGDIEKNKTTTFTYSKLGNLFQNRATWRNDDGLVQHLLERIDDLEERLGRIEALEKLPCKHSKK